MYRVRSVPHFWRNRIGFKTSKEIDAKIWDFTIHKRIAAYFKLFSQIQIFSMFLLVSHRNMISVYHMTKENKDDERRSSISESRTINVTNMANQKHAKNKNVDLSSTNGRWIQTIAFEDGYVR